jgi:hypothetical protein
MAKLTKARLALGPNQRKIVPAEFQAKLIMP